MLRPLSTVTVVGPAVPELKVAVSALVVMPVVPEMTPPVQLVVADHKKVPLLAVGDHTELVALAEYCRSIARAAIKEVKIPRRRPELIEGTTCGLRGVCWVFIIGVGSRARSLVEKR